MNLRRILGLKTRELLKMPFPRQERERIFLEMCNRMGAQPHISLQNLNQLLSTNQLIGAEANEAVETAKFQSGYMSDSEYRLFRYKPDESGGRFVAIRGELAEEPTLGDSLTPINVIGSKLGVNLADFEIEVLGKIAITHNVGIGGYAVRLSKGQTGMEFYLVSGSKSAIDYLEEVDHFYNALCEIHRAIGSRELKKDPEKYNGLDMAFHH